MGYVVACGGRLWGQQGEGLAGFVHYTGLLAHDELLFHLARLVIE